VYPELFSVFGVDVRLTTAQVVASVLIAIGSVYLEPERP
jgi:hypothetical protein